MDTHRLESLSDSVFAVAMTILVFDLRLPTSTTRDAFGTFVFEQWPHYLGYVISFVMISQIWLQHHWVFRHLRRVDSAIFVINIVLTLLVVFIPFSTSTLAYYVVRNHDQHSAAVFFGSNLTAATAVLALLWAWVARHGDLLQGEISSRTIKLLTRRLTMAPCLYLFGSLLATFNSVAGMAAYVAIDLSYLWLLRLSLLAG